LREMPGMIKELGDILKWVARNPHKPSPWGAAKTHLALTYGWKPLFSDLKTLLKLADSFNRKRQLFINMNKKGGAHVRKRLGTTSLSPPSSFTMTGVIVATTACTGPVNFTHTEQGWCTARLKAHTNLDHTLDTQVWNTVLGLNLSASTLWNAMPWSFLIDYFINVSDFMEATRGNVTFKYERLNVMCSRSIVGTYEPTVVKPSITLADKKCFFGEYKGRRVVPFAIPMITYRPWLSAEHMVNISALIMSGPLKRFHGRA